MKKFITLLFILAFTSTSFATRILTVRNSSNAIKNFYALEMTFSNPVVVYGPYTHALVAHYVQLKPGEFITFSNFDPVNINDFGYCPAPSSRYKMLPNLEHPPFQGPTFPYLPTNTFQWCIPDNDIWPILSYSTVKCNEVPQLPASLGPRAIFRGFKIADENSTAPIQGIGYFIANGYNSMHTYYSPNPIPNSDPRWIEHDIRETFLQLPPKNPTLEVHEVIFL